MVSVKGLWLSVPGLPGILAVLLLSGCGGADEPARPVVPGVDLVYVGGGACEVGSREGAGNEQPRPASVAPFWIGVYEVTRSDYARFLDHAGNADVSHPQFALESGRHVPVEDAGRFPVAHVSPGDAEAYCRWLSGQSGHRVRLPTEDEWECAARGGVRGARYPWGWGLPEGRACFGAPGPCPAGSYPANPFGLHDAAGNVYEWCAADGGGGGVRYARGGSWSEKDPRFITVYARVPFPDDYRDADVGFRVLVEP